MKILGIRIVVVRGQFTIFEIFLLFMHDGLPFNFQINYKTATILELICVKQY